GGDDGASHPGGRRRAACDSARLLSRPDRDARGDDSSEAAETAAEGDPAGPPLGREEARDPGAARAGDPVMAIALLLGMFAALGQTAPSAKKPQIALAVIGDAPRMIIDELAPILRETF